MHDSKREIHHTIFELLSLTPQNELYTCPLFSAHYDHAINRIHLIVALNQFTPMKSRIYMRSYFFFPFHVQAQLCLYNVFSHAWHPGLCGVSVNQFEALAPTITTDSQLKSQFSNCQVLMTMKSALQGHPTCGERHTFYVSLQNS